MNNSFILWRMRFVAIAPANFIRPVVVVMHHQFATASDPIGWTYHGQGGSF